jgi:hypothetical protein
MSWTPPDFFDDALRRMDTVPASSPVNKPPQDGFLSLWHHPQ